MENLSDDDFRSYMTDFQSYLHNIGDLGPIESPSTAVHEADTEAGEAGPVSAAVAPSSSSSSPPPSAAASASESSINWSAMNNEEEHRATTTTTMMTTTTTTTTTGMEMDEERSIIAEEDDEDRIVAEGCDLDCVTKDPDLIPSQKHSVWFPDVTRDEDDEVLRGPEVVGEDLMTGSEEDSGYSQVRSEEEKTKGEEPLSIEGEEGGEGGKGEWQNEVDTDLRRPDVEGSAAKEDREEDDGRGGGCDEDQPMSSSSSAIDGNVSWRYFGDDRIHSETEKEEEVEEDKEEVRGPEVATEDDDLKKVIEVEECSPREEKNERTKKDDDEILVDFGEVKAIVVDVPPLSSQGFRDEVSNEGEEKMGEETEEENRHGKAAAASVDAESCEEQSLVTFKATTAGDEIMNGSHSANHVNTESSHVVADKPGVPSAPTTFQASDLVLEEELDEEEKAFVKEQEAKYWEEQARLMTSSADEENKNTLIGHEEEEVTESSSDVKPAQNGGASAQLKIYPSQVRKTNNFLSEESQKRQDIDGSSRASNNDVLSPDGENENEEEEEKDLPEQGSVKSLLAQWRQMEQQKKQQQTTDAKDDHEHQQQHQQQQRHRRPITAGWSQATPEDDDEIQPTRSRVRDEILRMRSQSCDPMSDRKTNRLSPNDDDVPSVGRRVGRGRSRMGDDGEGEGEEGDEGAEQSTEHYRSQPSLTKAILAKFENLDLQAASSAIKPKSNKNFKWQVKETTRFCRPGFVPRSGR